MYSIEYEIIDPQGYVDTLSGLVSFPIDPTKIFPIASYQHGTTVEDDNVPSVKSRGLPFIGMRGQKLRHGTLDLE